MNLPDPQAAGPPAVSSAGAFDLLHPGVQRQLWQMQWAELRPLQVNAIRLIMQMTGDLVLSAATASGKTEAAFLPVLSKIADMPQGSVRALYVGPLKALINDQFERIGDLCAHLDVPVYHWHGDVAASEKAKMIQHPGGVLLITPESLESLFVNRSEHLIKLFGGLRFVVIDELHSFLDGERGLHLRSLLFRLKAIIREPEPFRCIGLSATIGDASDAQKFINPDQPHSVQFVNDDTNALELKLRIHGYRCVPFKEEEGRAERPLHVDRMAADIVAHCHGNANLVFANSKSQVEELSDVCQRLGESRGLADRFLVHHGSLSAEIREDAEATMKSGVMATTFCSSTLEMGVDIGSVKMVGQVGPPWSVASLKQRVGRSGRRQGEARILRMYITCDEVGPESNLFDRLHLDLIQAIAVTELMIARWVEPPSPPICDLSTLTQQIVSVIAQTGGLRADRVYDRLNAKGAFRDIGTALFARLLRQLAFKDIIEQTPDGDLILGLAGERLRKDRGFYAVFPTPEDYAVLHGAERIGTISTVIEQGEHLLLAGRRWQVTQVEPERLELYVQPARGWKPPRFSGTGGVIHPRIRQEMRKVLNERSLYSYLDETCVNLLREARLAAAMTGACSSNLVSLGPKRTALMTWTGNRVQETLQVLFATGNTEPRNEEIALVFDLPPDAVRHDVGRVAAMDIDLNTLARIMPRRNRRKYDWLLDDSLAALCIAAGWLDVCGARELLHLMARN